jgi:Ca2+-binding RTX toxin-like protein
MLGADGNDTLIGGIGNNDMFGETGDDQFQFFSAIDGDISVLTWPEQVIRARGGFGGSDVINDFTTGDTISISQLDRNAKVTITTNEVGAAVISIMGTASDGQPTNNQTITLVGVTRDQLLAPGAQLLAINGSFITTNDTVNDGAGGSVFTVGDGQPGSDIKGKTLVGSNVADSFSPVAGIATTANGIQLLSSVNDDVLSGNGGNDFMDGGAGNDIINGGNDVDTLVGNTGSDTLTGGLGSDFFRFVDFTFGEVDFITDFTSNSGGEVAPSEFIQISAAAFGGSLVAGQTQGAAAPANFFFSRNAGGVEGVNSTAPTGTSAFYYDTSGGGLYFDRDGGGTASTYTRFLQLSPVPINNNGIFGNSIQIIA